MEMTKNYSAIESQPEYDIEFWNLMRNKAISGKVISKGTDVTTGTYKCLLIHRENL